MLDRRCAAALRPFLVLVAPALLSLSLAPHAGAQPRGGALSFESGVNDFVRVPSHPSIDSGVFTMEAWVRREAPLLDQHCAIFRGANGVDMANGLVVTYGYLGHDAWTVFINGCPFTGTTTHPLGCWMHLAVTYDGNELVFYVNGVIELRQIYPHPLTWDTDLYFGVELDCPEACLDAGQAMAGAMDEVRLWSSIRDQSQIQASMTGFIDDPGSLVGWWTFDETSGLTAMDTSGRGNHGFLGLPPGMSSVVEPQLIPRRVQVSIQGTVDEAFSEPADVLYVNGSVGDAGRTVRLDRLDPIRITVIPPPHGPAAAPFVLYGYFDGATSATRLPDTLGWTAFPTPLNSEDAKLVTLVNNLGPISLYGFPLYSRGLAPVTVVNRSRGPRRPLTLSLQGLIRDNGSTHPDRVSVTNSIDMHIR
jgi:hypothetical protein